MTRSIEDIRVLVKIQERRDEAIRLLRKVKFQGWRSLAEGDHYAEIDTDLLTEIDAFLQKRGGAP
jgi:fructose-1,6-bisphosphatase/sedoheptulose 1,7-bisphosphatase-like protein